MRSTTRVAFVLAITLTAFAGCRPSTSAFITQEDLGSSWPFTVESGTLYCERQGNHVVFEAGGVHYAINASARGVASTNGYVAVDAIQRQLPHDTVRTRVDRVPEPRRRDVFAEAVRCDGSSTFGAVACRSNILKTVDITDQELTLIVEEGIALAWPPITTKRADLQPIITRGLALCAR
jgi:hypothetical protein